MAKKIEEAKQEQQSAVEKIKKRRLEETGTYAASSDQGNNKTVSSRADNASTSKSYSAVASQAAAHTAQARDPNEKDRDQKQNEQDAKRQAAKEALLAAARDKAAGINARKA